MISTLSICWASYAGSILKGQILKCGAPAFFHVAAVDHAGQEWRKKKLLPLNPNKYGPFADLPDYTFLDGRPTPLGSKRVKRALLQKDLAKKIVQFSEEMDFAVNLHKSKLQEELDRKQAILARKLKPKGRQMKSSS